MGKHKLLSLDTHKYKTTFTSTTKIELGFSILRKAESIWKKEPWTITTVHTNGTIRIQCGTKSERINIRRVTPFSEGLLNNIK
jgi:hypothetical protein